MWLDEDTEAALEWTDYKASLCSGCGNPRSECMDPKRSEAYEAVPLQCFACAARDAEHRQANEARQGNEYGGGSFDGLFVSVIERGV